MEYVQKIWVMDDGLRGNVLWVFVVVFFLLIFSILEALNSFVLTHGNSLGDVYVRVVDIEFKFSDFVRFWPLG